MSLIPDPNDPFVTLARVAKTQGRIGEVACDLHTDFPEKFADRRDVLLFDSRRGTRTEARIENHWFHKEFVILKFVGVDSITAAEALLGSLVQLPESDRAPLEPGAYYISDLIGCALFDHGVPIGTIRDVNTASPGVPLLVVVRNLDARNLDAADLDAADLEIPFAEAYLESIDLSAKEVRMALPPGLLELNA